MNSDLIVMTFPRQEEARQARQALEMMHGKHILGLENAALVTRDGLGRHRRISTSGIIRLPMQLQKPPAASVRQCYLCRFARRNVRGTG